MSNEYNYYTPESGPDYNYEQNQEPKKEREEENAKTYKGDQSGTCVLVLWQV